MAQEHAWKRRVKDELAALISIHYTVQMTRETRPRSAKLDIDVRKFNERDDEIAYWQEELSMLPFLKANYEHPKSGRNLRVITFTLHEKEPEHHETAVH
jgi:hypothetical protein